MKQGKRRCTSEYDLRLSAFFGTSPSMWMNLQLDYEFMRANREKGEAIRKEVQPCSARNTAIAEMRNLTRKRKARNDSLLRNCF